MTGLILIRPKNHPESRASPRPVNLPAQFDQVLQTARDKVRSHGNDPGEMRKLAHLYQANRLYPEARGCYQAIAVTPAGLTARDHYYLADIAQNENDLAGAQTELRAVLQTEPGYVPARLALAEALFKSGREEEAGKEYSAVLAIEAHHPQASLGLARIELQRGDEEAAVARLDELMAEHPEATSAAALFAQVLERRGEADRAIAMAQWSLQKPEPIPADPWMSELWVDLYDIQRLGLKF
jgi:tetratricopeptide (TPR) repeat protein